MTDEKIFELARKYVHYDMSVDTLAFARALLAESARDTLEHIESLRNDIEAIDTWYRGSPSYEHDAGWFKAATIRMIDERMAQIVPANAGASDKPDSLNAAWEQYNKAHQWGHEPTARAIFEDGWNAAK